MVDQDSRRTHIISRLQTPVVQEALADLVDDYWDRFQVVFRIATAEKNGVRPANVANEMFSCLHHIARGLTCGTTADDSVAEIRKAYESHIKRATLDSYKIAINSILEEDEVLAGLLDYILLADEVVADFKDKVENIKNIHRLKQDCKTAYVKAKEFEAAARWSEAIRTYHDTLDIAKDLRKSLQTLQEDPITIAFLAREGRRRQERTEDRKHDFRKGMIIAILASAITAVSTLLIRIYLPQYLP
ncbi:MAG: hypothetical protein HQL76_08930 [Magnetococcales bacterium]|nr:hypothetical protein [Magnetococcales bacterium]